MTIYQPRQCLGEDQEKKEEDSPSFGRCRPLSRVADSGPKAKVNIPYISALPSVKLYPRMCGLNPEHVLRPGFSPVDPSSIPGVLTSRGRPNKGPADDYPPSKLQKLPHPGLAEGSELPVQLPQELPLSREQPSPRPAVCSKQPMLQQRSSSPQGRPPKGPADSHLLPEPRGQPQQVGLAEVLPGRVRNLPGPRTSRQLEPSDAPRQPLLQQMAAPVHVRP